ncbi:MAG: ATPase AAA [Saprospiraceae bacterium]|nr:MAG: ATPase AAA [Saprospiraceae bacterium]
MEKIHYPLLYYSLPEGAVLGILVGTEYQVIEKDLRTVKTILSDHLQKQYKKYDDYPFVDLRDPRLKIIELSIRPSFRDESSAFPLSQTIKVPVPIVYGENDQGFFECHLPLFEESFYYYDPRQFDALVSYFTTNLLNQLAPENIYRLMLHPKPELDTIALKVNYDRNFEWKGLPIQRQYQVLSRLAEQYPPQKGPQNRKNYRSDSAWEMEDIVSDIIDKLITTRSNLLLVGKRGVGKTACLNQAIKKITLQVRRQKLDYSFWRIRSQRIVSSGKYLGEWQENCEQMVEELNAANGILWVVDLIQLLKIGGEGPEDSVAAFLHQFLQQDKLQLVGELTPEELESMRRLLPGFAQVFQIITIEELSAQKSQLVMEHFARYAKQQFDIHISQNAIELSFRLLNRYYPYESFPGKGINFLSNCVNEGMLKEKSRLTRQDIIKNFIGQTGLPELFLRDDLLLDTDDLYKYFNSRIIGQPDAVEKMSTLVKIFKAGLNNPHKPINTLLFAGPTGVGKTASAKALADYFFGKGQKRSPLIRIDMSEFQHPSQINRLIGYGKEVGQLVREIRERPFSVLLLDEIEKAAPSLFDALLTVLDEGILVDAYGRITNFRNTIIIMTSNLGATTQRSIGFQETTRDADKYLSAIEQHFRPEFVNRIDGFVMFRSLNKADIQNITIKELEALKKREGFTKRGLNIVFTKAFIDQLILKGFDARYGARPLQRAIEQQLVNPMANWMLDNPDQRNCSLEIDYLDGIKINLLSDK